VILQHGKQMRRVWRTSAEDLASNRYGACNGDFVLVLRLFVLRLCHAALRPAARTRVSRSSITR
jgi:hypothetical protein